MAKSQTPRVQGKRHIARARQEQERQRQLLMVLGGVGLLVVVVLAMGLIRSLVIIPRQAVAVVEGTEISTSDYRKRVRYERFLIDEQRAQLEAQLGQLGDAFPDNPQLQQSLTSQTEQQLLQLLSVRSQLDQTALEGMIEEELVIQEAARRGITVSDEEVDIAFNRDSARRTGGYTQPDADATVTARLVASDNATATAAQFTPTPTLTATTETTGTTETEEVPVNPPQPTPTINVLSAEALGEAVTTYVTLATDAADLTEAELRELTRRSLLREKLMEAIGDEAETVTLQANARHILVGVTENDDEDVVQERREEAEALKTRWEGGESFEEISEELTEDTESNASASELGWFSQDDMVQPFGEAAFTQEVGAIGEPVRTQFGWHVIQVVEREERELEGAALSRARSDAYNAWLVSARAGNVENRWTVDSPPTELGQ